MDTFLPLTQKSWLLRNGLGRRGITGPTGTSLQRNSCLLCFLDQSHTVWSLGLKHPFFEGEGSDDVLSELWQCAFQSLLEKLLPFQPEAPTPWFRPLEIRCSTRDVYQGGLAYWRPPLPPLWKVSICPLLRKRCISGREKTWLKFYICHLLNVIISCRTRLVQRASYLMKHKCKHYYEGIFVIAGLGGYSILLHGGSPS